MDGLGFFILNFRCYSAYAMDLLSHNSIGICHVSYLYAAFATL